MSTVRELVNQAATELQTAGCTSAQNDAELLLAHVMKIDRSDLAKVALVSPEQIDAFQELVSRRSKREPLQHLTGLSYFRHLTLQVGPGVFVPRPETELLVQAGLDELAKMSGPKLAVDLCSGSGAVALSLALESPNTTVHAVELSEAAFGWLEKNVAAYAEQLARLNSSVITWNDDASDRGLLGQVNGTVDVVLSNPPYIPDAMIPREIEVATHDPALALYGGHDGLEIIRGLLPNAAQLLMSDGLLLIEHADVQGETLPQLLADDGNWDSVKDLLDYAQKPRHTFAKRK